MRVACIKDGVVVNAIEIESLDKVPDIVGVQDGVLIKKDEVQIVQTETGSVGDLYIEGRGFFRYAGK